MRSMFPVAIATVVFASAAGATETITYTYDARGRVLKTEHSGGVNNGVTSTYTYDKADNRTSKTVTGA